MWSSWILYYLEKWASRTSKHLFSRPFFSYSRIPQAYSRTPQVRCQAAGDQSCSWYFIGTFWLRETVAFEMMRQLLSLGRTGFMLLTCSPQNGDLVSQVCFTSVCAVLLTQNGHKPTWTCCSGWCGWVERAGGSGLLTPPRETACEEPTEVAGSRKVSAQTDKGKLCLCASIMCLVCPTVTLKNFCDEFWEKGTLHDEN